MVKVTLGRATLATIQRTYLQSHLTYMSFDTPAIRAPPQVITVFVLPHVAAPNPLVALHLLAPLGMAHPT